MLALTTQNPKTPVEMLALATRNPQTPVAAGVAAYNGELQWGAAMGCYKGCYKGVLQWGATMGCYNAVLL